MVMRIGPSARPQQEALPEAAPTPGEAPARAHRHHPETPWWAPV